MLQNRGFPRSLAVYTNCGSRYIFGHSRPRESGGESGRRCPRAAERGATCDGGWEQSTEKRVVNWG
jgi:hypothetical protein